MCPVGSTHRCVSKKHHPGSNSGGIEGMKSIKIQNLCKEFLSIRGRTVALRDVNLKIEPGTFFVLLGPSGCGKTTLLNIVAGIEKPSQGEIWIDDKPVVSSQRRIFLTPRERNIAMVFQSYALYPHMNVFENIAFPLKIAKVGKDEVKVRVKGVAKTLEISHLLKAKPSELSGGQRQRIAIGRAIVRRPNALLLDEPLSNLDAQLRTDVRGELKRLQKQLEVSTLYVTHDQTEAMILGEKMAVMRDGQIQQVGAPDKVYNDPQNIFVARFVGTPPMNLLDGKILNLAKRKLEIGTELNKDEIIVGVRPEHIYVTKEEEESLFRGRISLVSSLGTQILLYLKIGTYEVLATSFGSIPSKEGEPVGVNLDEKHIFVFDKNDGRRIKLSN
jgi:multiple sugar transport system ATP-binding protein